MSEILFIFDKDHCNYLLSYTVRTLEDVLVSTSILFYDTERLFSSNVLIIEFL